MAQMTRWQMSVLYKSRYGETSASEEKSKDSLYRVRDAAQSDKIRSYVGASREKEMLKQSKVQLEDILRPVLHKFRPRVEHKALLNLLSVCDNQPTACPDSEAVKGKPAGNTLETF
jgi:hypothetical protein